MSGKTISTSETRIEALKLQSSAYGVTLPMVWGVTRISGNLIDYNGFKAVPHTTSQGGKGGVKVQNTTYTYTASVMMGLCRGQVTSLPRIWRGKKLYSGGVTPSQVQTTVESYTPPGSGAMQYTAAQAATYVGVVAVTNDGGFGDGVYSNLLSQGADYTVSAGVFTIVNEAYRGLPLNITYQYTTGGVSQTALVQLGLTFKTGAIGQAAWSYMTTNFPAKALGYSGLAYVAGQDYDLGTGAQVENHTFEVVGPMAYHLGSTLPDVDPALMLRDALTDSRDGAGFPGTQLGTWSTWSDFCVASGLLISPALEEQVRAADVVATAAELTNAGAVWSGGRLKMIPYADTSVTGNGRTFTAATTPVYDLDDECWLQAPVVELKSPADRYNHVRVEFLNRANLYNAEIAEAKDQADIDANGLRSMAIKQAHWICEASVARQVAQITLQRSLYVTATYKASFPWHFAMLECMDLNTLTDAGLGLNKLPGRITVIEEDESGELTITHEDYPAATCSAAVYPSQAGTGYQHDYNAAPGDVDAPVFFEAPAARTTTGLEVYTAVKGSGTNWGGCQVWVSLDGTNYRQIATVYGGARYGHITGPIASGSLPVSTSGQLISGTAADAAALNTLCWLGGTTQEYIAYQTATLSGPGTYTLAGLVRAAYSTSQASAHATNDPFVRVDEAIAKSGPLDPSMVGNTIQFKFASFNIYGGGQQGLADVSAYNYTITGVMASLTPGISGKGVKLRTSGLTFQYPKTGGVNPAALTVTVERKGTLTGAASFSVTAGTVTLTGSGDTRSIDPASMLTDTATIRVTVSDAVASYIDEVTIAKVREGADGVTGATGATGSTGPTGPGHFTLVNQSGCTISGSTVTKTGGAPSTWDSSVTSAESFAGGAFCSARAGQTNAAIMFGLTTDPTTDNSYSSIDYAWYFTNVGTVDVYENGTPHAVGEAYTANSTVLSMQYDGSTVKYLKDGVVKRTVTAPAGLQLYLDTSFHGSGGVLNGIAFGPMGSTAVSAVLSNEATVFPADSSGAVTSYAGNTTTMSVFVGGVDDSVNWTFSKVDSSGVSSTLSGQTVTVSSIAGATDSGYVDITAARSGLGSITKRFSISKSKTGAVGATGATGATGSTGATGPAGSNGQRGSIHASASIAGTSWSDSSANAAISAAGYGSPVTLDQVTLYNSGGSYSETRYWNGSSWIVYAALVDGNLVVTGSILTAALAVGAVSNVGVATVTADTISVASSANASRSGTAQGPSMTTIGRNVIAGVTGAVTVFLSASTQKLYTVSVTLNLVNTSTSTVVASIGGYGTDYKLVSGVTLMNLKLDAVGMFANPAAANYRIDALVAVQCLDPSTGSSSNNLTRLDFYGNFFMLEIKV